ncbi:putative ribonuclease H-like domain-containing protein [Tanacetum coccineum]
MAGSDDENPPPPPPPQTPTQQAPHTVSTIKLPILKKGEYDIWAMKMEHYLSHTDYPIWEVIQKGNGPVSVSTDTNGVIKVLPPKTAEEILARERERKARTTLLMALPEDHLAKFHKMTDAKEMWDAIKSRFGGNDESKKMQKYILKQQFEGFSVSNSEGLHKGYDRFQSLLSQLEIHGAGVSTEDANQKFLRSLPSSWSQVSLVMRTKPGVDSLSFDDLYNNLRVFESDVKGSTGSSSSAQNVAFVSSESTSSTNDVSTAYGVSTSSGHNSQRENSSSYTDELMYSFFANQSSGPQLDHEDLEQLDEFDLEEMDLKWQVAMISMRLKKFYKKTGRKLQFDAKEPVGFDKTKVEEHWYKAKDNGRRPGKQEEPKALVTLDGDGVDWNGHAEEEQENFALMAYSNSGSDTEVPSCSKECVESYAKLKKLYDEQREQLGDASIEIKAYTLALAKVEAQLVCHQKNQLAYEEKIRFMKIDLDDKTDVLTYHKKLLAEAVKEKEELKTKLENFQSSSKNLNKLLNSQMSAKDKSGLGFANVEGMHAVPPPMNQGSSFLLVTCRQEQIKKRSQFTYGPKQSKTSESDTQTSDFDSYESNSSVETLESVPEPIVNEPKVVSKPKVWSDAPIIEEYESDSDDEYVIKTSKEQEKPSFAFVNTFKHVKTPREIVKEQTEEIPVNTARHNVSSQAISTNTARKVNAVRLIVNDFRPRNVFHKSHSPTRRPFNRTTTPKAKFSNQKVNTVGDKAVSAVGGIRETAVKPSAGCNWRPKRHYWNKVSKYNGGSNSRKCEDPHKALKNKGIVDSGCFRHMTGNKAYLAKYQDYNGGPVAFGGSKGYITGKGKIRTGKLDFEDVCFVKELQLFNLFFVSQMCDKKNKVLFTDTECLVLSPDFKLPDENQVLLRVPRQNNIYNFNLENIVPTGGLACLIAKATFDESNKWHRRLGHVNFKKLNKLVKGNLIRGLPLKIFQNDHTCVACQKGKQHKASCKAKLVSSISQPLQLLHMDLFGPTSVRSINHKTYCLVITDDFSRSKGIKREYSIAKTPQQNGVAERKNRTLIKAAKTMLADSFIPNTFWAEAVSTACYVLNRVLVTKPQNKTPYELITGKILIISYIRHFGCHVTILNTIDHLGKFDGKSDEGFLVGYSLNSKALRVYNLETKRVKENLHINFLANKLNVVRKGPNWLFDLDYLTDSMNYQPVTAENKANKIAGPKEANHSAGTQDNIDTGYSEKEAEPAQEYCVLPLWSSYTSTVKSSEAKKGEELERLKRQEKEANDAVEALRKEFAQKTEDLLLQAGTARATSTNTVNTIPALEDIYENPCNGIFTNASYDDEGAVADFTNLETTVNIEPKKISEGLKDESWVDAMQEELLQFKIQKSAFLYGTIDEEVYLSQPPGFVDPKFPKKVYKVVKALYGLHKAPRAWYATLSPFLEKSRYRRGTIDKTLFIKKDKKDIMLVQVYVDDIIFSSTKKSWCDEFEALMKSRFQMSSMGELTFFLGLQVKQKEDGIFISQDKYVAEILKKFDFMSVKTASTPIETHKPLVKDEEATDVDVHLYRSMIGSLMYLTTSRPDIMFVVCACSRFQVTPKTLHLNAVKRIFRYLKGKPKLGLWYPRESSFDLVAYSDSDYGGANLDRKSTTGGCQFLGHRLISWQCKKQTIVATSTTEAEYVAVANCCGQVLWIHN